MLSVGRGIADITGEAADCGMLGYGKSDQRTAGIHQRLRSRAFVFRDDSQDGDARLLLIVAELPLPMQNVNEEVLRRLADLYGDTYSEQNTLITATHTHAGPGGYCGYLLYNLTTSGFRPATFAAIVDGIVESVEHAHADVAPAEVSLSHGELYGASINRSPSAFDRNPPADKAFFPKRVDPHTTLVRIDRGEATVGVIHFFATHGTSMTNRNHLISGDNKGFAAYHWERTVGGADYLAGQPDFIAAFAQTNPGDMSPNVDGPLSPEAPPDREFDNTRRTGLCQFEDAFTQLSGATPIGAGIDARFTYVDLGSVLVRGEYTPDGEERRASDVWRRGHGRHRRGPGLPWLSPRAKPVLGQTIPRHVPAGKADGSGTGPQRHCDARTPAEPDTPLCPGNCSRSARANRSPLSDRYSGRTDHRRGA